ncbi:MAG: recombinase family protein [Nitrososphaerales archaeon]
MVRTSKTQKNNAKGKAVERWSNAILFARVSTKEQEFENQLTAGRRYAREHHMALVKTIHLQHTGYQNAYEEKLSTICRELGKPEIEHVIVWAVDRLARNQMAFCKLLEYLRSRNPRLTFHFIVEEKTITVKEFFPANTEACAIFAALNAGQTASAVLSRKIKTARNIAKAQYNNPYLGGVVPLGKKVEEKIEVTPDGNKTHKILVKDDEQHDLAHLIIHLTKTDADELGGDFDCSETLNAKSIYFPFFVKGKKEYRLWTADDCARMVELEEKGYIPERFQAYFDEDAMDLGEDAGSQEEQEVKVLDTMVYRRKKYSKVMWPEKLATGEPNICWIPSDDVKTVSA